MSSMERLEYLRQSRLCKGLTEDELAGLSAISQLKRLNKGEILFFEGDEARGFYLLLKGRVRIYKSSPEGKEQTLHQINPGQIFAEVAIFEGRHYPANCSAVQESVVAFFPKTDFIRLIEKSPQISLKIIASMAGFLREFTETVENLALKEVPSRIAGYLLKLRMKAKDDTITLDMTKSELAKKLGTQSETLSRGFRKLSDKNIIKVNGKRIAILDNDRLIDIAEGEKI
ncbi:MAG: cyclic nucleotide-binding domain-containing protein [candidate division Zixibacteria bacterium]|nr:cyclic nucleotide-binding domain-containing protein [candidate division Zixibacteria bacterium]